MRSAPTGVRILTLADLAPDLKTTPLTSLHQALGARMVPFAGYTMPVQYPTGILAEHAHTRTAASLFDVAHMGIAQIVGPDRATALERLVPAAIASLRPGRLRYTMLTNAEGGIEDDLMVTAGADRLTLVLNAGRKDHDLDLLRSVLGAAVTLAVRDDLALLALQGPQAEAVLDRLVPGVASLDFMTGGAFAWDGEALAVSRSGYTGEDGFEIAVPADAAMRLAERLLAEPEVAPAGLGARDSLRLEAGLCLYGQDLTTAISPVEADLGWTIQKRRRERGGFPGADRILREMRDGPGRRRVGLRPDGRMPVRAGADLVTGDGDPAGTVTSGGFGGTVGAPIAMGLVAAACTAPGTVLHARVRGRTIACTVTPLPFVPHRYRR